MACKKALEKASGAAWEINTLQKGGGVEEVASEGVSQESSADICMHTAQPLGRAKKDYSRGTDLSSIT